jgi:site-specific DNA recombinase
VKEQGMRRKSPHTLSSENPNSTRFEAYIIYLKNETFTKEEVQNVNDRQQNGALGDTAVIYARYSSHNQREESIEAQIRACEDYAKRKNLRIIGQYTDSAKSGTTANRESFLQMIDDSAKGEFNFLIIHKLDRFSRDKFDAVTYKRKLKMNGVTILSVMENLDSSPESVMLESCLEGMAQYYSLNLAREVMKGMKESAYKCTHLGGRPPLGYDVDPVTKKYVINSAEVAIVKYIFQNYANGVGYNRILDYLNGMGYKSKYGRPFGKNSLYSILGNEKYVGKFIFNKKLEKDVSGKRNPQWKPKEEWIVVDGGLPAIIDEETFNVVQAKLESNKRRGGKFRAKEIYLLSGLIVCGECGNGMYGNTRKCGRNKSRYSSYKCSSRANHKGCENKEIRKECLENYVLDELYTKLFSENSIKKLSAMLNDYNRKEAEEAGEETKLASGELTEINEKISRIVRLVSESGISVETVKDELKRLEERKRFVEDYLKDIHLKNNVAVISEEAIVELIGKSREFVKNHNISECQNFIHSYIKKVIVYNDRVEVLFKIHVPDEANDTITALKTEGDIDLLKKEYRKAG